MLVLKDIGFKPNGTSHPLLTGINIKFPGNHLGAIAGPSGCGKSTLLKIIAGILPHYDGNILWNGRHLEEEDLPPYALGYVPQFTCTQPSLTVKENLWYCCRLRVGGTPKEIEARLEQTLAETGLHELQARRAGVLSGGQLRRLSLAMELVTRPGLLLADEVTSGLDPKSEEEITALLMSLARESSRIVLIVTHSFRFLSQYDSVTVLHEGRLVYSADPRLLTSYFNVPTPEEIFPVLAESKSAEWSQQWDYARPDSLTSSLLLEAVESVLLPEEEALPMDPPTPGFFSQTLTWLERRVKIFFRDPLQVALQLALMLIFPAVVTLFAYRGLPSVRNMAMTADQGIVDQLREALAFTIQASRLGTLISGLAMFQVILLALMASNNSAREVVTQRDILEKEKLAGLRPGSVLAGIIFFLSVLVFFQSLWMTLFVRAVCQFPGDVLGQFWPFLALCGAITSVCLAISSWVRTNEQASLASLYLVGFQLPLSGALLALPDFLGSVTRPLIAAYWAWSAYLQTMRHTRFYDLVTSITETPLSSYPIGIWILAVHLFLGVGVAYFGIARSRWP